MRWRRLSWFGLGAAVLGVAFGSSCGSTQQDGAGTGAAGAGAAGSGGSAGAANSGGGGQGGAAGTGAADSGLGEPCPWEGWYRAPRMPPGCLGLCVPDDVSLRVPKIEWLDKPEWCAGCKWLATPWATGVDPPVSPALPAIGPGVRLFTVGIRLPKLSGIAAIYDEKQQAVAAWRFDHAQDCGTILPFTLSSSGHMGGNFVTKVFETFHFAMRPVEQIAELMYATDSTLTFPKEVIGKTAPNGLAFSPQRVAVGLLGRLMIGDIQTQELVWADLLPGAPKGGEMTEGVVVDDVVFVDHWDGAKLAWWVYASGTFQPFLGGADRNVRYLAADATTLAWIEGSEPVLVDGDTVFQRYDLYTAPFTSDPTELQPRLLLAKAVPDLGSKGFTSLVLANGYAAMTSVVETPAYKTEALVVRVADGKAWRSKLPDGYNWGYTNFPAPDELWGAADPGVLVDTAESIVRVPYSAMQVIQEQAPQADGG